MARTDLHKRVEGLGLRCHAELGDRVRAWCGLPAVALRKGRMLAPDAYLCAHHARPGDAPLPALPLARSVTVRLDVTLAGVSQMHVPAQNEAVARVEAALRELGGVIDVQRVTSEMVRIGAPSSQGAPNASRAEG